MSYKSSLPEEFYKKKMFLKISPKSISRKFRKIFKNTFSIEDLLWLLLELADAMFKMLDFLFLRKYSFFRSFLKNSIWQKSNRP